MPTVGLLGAAGAMLGFALVVPLVQAALVGLAWLVRGRPGQFSSYSAAARRYENVEGLVATHLALASLTLVVLLLARFLNHRRPRWVWSVQPGMRWRFLLLVALVAAVVLNLTQILVRGVHPWHLHAPPHWWVWMLAILVTAPLQALAEEVFFRGYLVNCLTGMGLNSWFAVVGSALVFALAHGTQNLWLFVDRFAFGLLAGLLVVITGGLEAGIAAHAVNNVFAFGYAVFQGGAAHARGITAMGWVDAAWDVAGFATVAAAAWWIGSMLKVARRTPVGRDLPVS